MAIESSLNGKTISSITGCYQGSDSIEIKFSDNTYLRFFHYQNCCESVEVEDVVGDPNNHEGAILYGIDEKTSNDSISGDESYSFTYTFYTIKTSKGYLDIRWYGSSNGYYSESVSYETGNN